MKKKLLVGILLALCIAVPTGIVGLGVFADDASKVAKENKLYTVWCVIDGVSMPPLDVRGYEERGDGWVGLLDKGEKSLPVKATLKAEGNWGCLVIREDHLGD